MTHVPTCGTKNFIIEFEFHTSCKQIGKSQKVSNYRTIFQNSIAKNDCNGKIFSQLSNSRHSRQFRYPRGIFQIYGYCWNHIFIELHFLWHMLWNSYEIFRQHMTSLLVENQQIKKCFSRTSTDKITWKNVSFVLGNVFGNQPKTRSLELCSDT